MKRTPKFRKGQVTFDGMLFMKILRVFNYPEEPIEYEVTDGSYIYDRSESSLRELTDSEKGIVRNRTKRSRA